MYQVVIVEDDPMVSLLNQAFIQKDARFEVAATVHDGHTALKYLEAHTVDLLILDVFMPVTTGAQLLHTLRERDIGVDVIMVTAANDTKTVDGLLKLGVVDYLVKPFTYERFAQALEGFCRHRAAVGGAAVSQEALDQLFAPGHSGVSQSVPKGFQESTLALIRDCLRGAKDRHLASEEIASTTQLSAVTVRHYMNYLLERGEVLSQTDYDTGGRPSRRYRSV